MGELSYFSGKGAMDTALLGLTTGEMIDLAASRFGDVEGFVSTFQNIRKTFRELKYDVDNLASGLISLGLKSGDRVGVWSPNTYEAYLSQLAGWKAGFVVVCLNSALRSNEMQLAINKVGVRCLIISKPFRSQSYYGMVMEMGPEIESWNYQNREKNNLKCAQLPTLEFLVSVETDLPGTLNFESVLESGKNNIVLSREIIASANIQFDDVSSIFFTSGTTGSPKAVMLTHHNLVNNGYLLGRRLGLQPKEKITCPAPLFHGYGCQIGIFAAMLYGATTVLPSYGYDIKAIAKVIEEEKCPYLTATPTMLVDMLKLLERNDINLTSLKCITTGGAICGAGIIFKMKEKLPESRIVNIYGMTEMCTTFMGAADVDTVNNSASVGYPLEYTEAKVVDKNGKVVPFGVEGELLVRGYAVTGGFWGNEDIKVLDRAGWFHTGDIFTMAPNGYGHIVGRIKDIIHRGGEKVNPKEIEDFLKTHPLIEDAQVFSVPDERLGEVPATWVKLKAHEETLFDENDIKQFCKAQISHYKIPQYIHFCDTFPHNTLGKVQKFVMREETMKKLMGRQNKI